MKKCSRCSNERDNKNSRYCLPCRRDYQRERVQYRWKVLRRYKEMKGCKSCGYKKCGAALQFNHIDPSTKLHHNGIGRLVKGAVKMPRIKAEIAKCEILCANCHAELSFKKKHHLLGEVNERT